MSVKGDDGLAHVAYIALVALQHPMWQPDAETVAPLGDAVFRLAAGRYRAVVGAPGFEDQVTDVTVAKGRNLNFTLQRSVSVGGVVTDASGTPLRDVLVTQTRLMGPREIGIYSDVARDFFRPQWSTRTDASGRWSLPGSSAGSVAVLFESEGHAPVGLMTSSRDHKTVLAKGVSLTIRADRFAADLLVTLVPEAGNISAVPTDWQPRVFSRLLTGTTLNWPSLAEGKYRVRARYMDPRRFAPSFELAAVDLTQSQTIAVTIPPAQNPRTDPAVLFLPGKTSADLVGAEGFAKGTATIESVRIATQNAAGGLLAYLDLPSSQIRSAFIVTQSSIFIPNGEIPTRATMSPRADLAVRVKNATDPFLLPSEGVARFELCDDASHVALPFSVGRDGAISLPFPTLCRSVVLDLSPLEPVTFIGRLQPGEKRSLGERSLKAGAAVDVRVAEDPTGTPIPAAIVQVIDAASGEEVTLASGEADAKGRLTLRGLPAARDLTFVGRDPRSDRLGSVQLRLEAGRSATIDPLPIPLPAKLVVEPHLAPAFHERFPKAQVQSITLDRASDGSARFRRHAVLGESDKVRFDNLTPGHWLVIAIVEALDGIHVLSAAQVDLTAGEERRIAPEVAPLVFDGMVTFGGKGIASTIIFDDPPSPTGVGRSIHSDKDGRFTALLPVAGLYSVQVIPFDQPNERISLGDVSLVDSSQPVRLEIPDGALLVHVSAANAPAAGAEVSAIRYDASAQGPLTRIRKNATTDAAGNVRFESLLGGTWVLRASSSQRTLAETVVTLPANDQKRVDLVLEPPMRLAGFVHDGDVPVADAAVDCLYLPKSNFPGSARGRTEAEGHFEILFPSLERPILNCGVSTRNGDVEAFTTAPTIAADLHLSDKDTGVVIVSDWGQRLRGDVYWLVADDGRMFNLAWAASSTRALWKPLVIRSLSEGSWKIVRADTLDKWVRMGTAGGNALDSDATFQLKKGATQKLRLDEKEERQ